MIEIIPPTIPLRAHLSAGVKGEYLPSVINPDGSEEFPLGREWIPNVITNIGIDYWMNNASYYAINDNRDRTLENSIAWARAGTGTADALPSDQNLVNQLAGPTLAPTNTTFTGAGANASDLSSAASAGTVMHKITKQFAAAGSNVTVTEVGLGWQSTGNTLFSRVKLPSGIALTTGQILRLAYQLTVSLPQFNTASTISGLSSGTPPNSFDLAGSLRWAGTAARVFGNLNSNGEFSTNSDNGKLWLQIAQGGSNDTLALLTNSSFPAVGANGSWTGVAGDLTNAEASSSKTYTGTGNAVDTKYWDGIYTFGASSPANTVTTVRSLVWDATSPFTAKGSAPMILLSSNQTKSNLYQLQIGLRTSWARI